jgi:hypothetical protein
MSVHSPVEYRALVYRFMTPFYYDTLALQYM